MYKMQKESGFCPLCIWTIQIYLSAVNWCIVFSHKSILWLVAVPLIWIRYLNSYCVNNVYKNQRTNDQTVFLGLKMFISIQKQLIDLFLELYNNVKKLWFLFLVVNNKGFVIFSLWIFVKWPTVISLKWLQRVNL